MNIYNYNSSNFYNRILDKIEAILSSEHDQLSLWFSVGIFCGILYFFSNELFPNIKYLVIFPLIFTLFRKHAVILKSLLILSTSILFGLVISYVRIVNNRYEKIQYSTQGLVSGIVTSIHPKAGGVQITLKNLVIIGHLLNDDAAKIRINVAEKYSSARLIQVGDEILLDAILHPPPAQKLYYGYDFALLARFNQISAVGYAISKPEIIKKHAITLYDKIQVLRQNLYKSLYNIFSDKVASFVAALLIGDSGGIDRNDMQNIRYSGISHLICVSGLHISLIAAIFFKIARFMLNISDIIAFRFNIQAIAAISSILATSLYWLLTDLQIAATRAFIMSAVVIYAVIFGGKVNHFRLLNFACILLLMFNPENIFKPSFQLSFLAVLALFFSDELNQKLLQKYNFGSGFLGRITKYIFYSIFFSFNVSIITAPIAIYNFYIFANYSILANLIAVPITLYMIIPLLMIFILFLPLGNAMYYYPVQLIEILVKFLLTLSDKVAHAYYSVSYIGYITSASIVIYMLGFFMLTLWKGSLRFFGFIPIVFSVILMLISPKPLMIISLDDLMLAAQNNDNQLEIYAKKHKNFQARYWTDWFGQKELIMHEENIAQKNWFFASHGKKIAVIFNDKFDISNLNNYDLVLDSTINQHVSNSPIATKINKIIDLYALLDLGVNIFVFLDKPGIKVEIL